MKTYAQAVAFAAAQHANPTQSWWRLCQKFSRSCVGSGPFGLTARRAWESIPLSHRHAGSPPAGSLAYWGGTVAGHAAFVVEDGDIWSTDIKRRGQVDRVHYTLIHEAWGLDYVGWIDATPSGKLPIVVPPPVISVVRVSQVQPGDKGEDVLIVQRALRAEPTIRLDFSTGPGVMGPKTRAAYADWQKHLGYTGADADGKPGLTSLTALGKRHGFKAAP